MFSTEDLKVLGPKYFSIIAVADYDVTIMSRNTGHNGTSIIQSIREREPASYFTSIRPHTHIISMAGQILCGRRCGASKGMISGR